MNDLKLNKVEELLVAEKAVEAQNLFDSLEESESLDYLIVKGRLDQKFQRFGDALNSFSKVLEVDADNELAKNNIHLIKNILNFWNPEMFNP